MPVLSANDLAVYYELHGQGEPLVFIHGLGSSTRDWEAQVPAFAGRYQVLTFDLRGHGRTAKPPGPYTVPQFADDTAGLLRALELPPAHIVGLSLGGSVAFQLTLAYPALVRTLTIVNSAPSLAGIVPDADAEIARRVGIVERQGMRGMGEALSANLFPGPAHAAARQTFVDRWAENDATAYLAATRAMLGWDVGDQVARIGCPTCIITADQDYSPVAMKQAYAARIPNAELIVVPDSHHMLPVENPPAFNAVLAAFLARHPAGS
jgi:pimeloyl-ACP methyl ester carboxylesterase